MKGPSKSGMRPKGRWNMTETNFGKKLRKKLTEAGWMCEKIPCGRFKQGFPDCILIDPDGMVIFAELKVGYNPVTPLQRKKLEQLDGKGCNACVIRLCDNILITSWRGRSFKLGEKGYFLQKEIEQIWEGK